MEIDRADARSMLGKNIYTVCPCSIISTSVYRRQVLLALLKVFYDITRRMSPEANTRSVLPIN